MDAAGPYTYDGGWDIFAAGSPPPQAWPLQPANRDWQVMFDHEPEKAVATRRRV